MEIKDILGQGEPTLSFEIFPPKTEDKCKSVEEAVVESAGLSPAFMSVIYGTDGRTSRHTMDIASMLNNAYQVPTLAHLTCVSSTKSRIHQVLRELKERDLENMLALRGDIPEGDVVETDCRYASQLIYEIKQTGDFCVDAACCPEGRVGSVSKTTDAGHLEEKVETGCDFMATQMFSGNNILYDYLYRIRERGIAVPVVAGIIPVTNVAQIKQICQMSGTYLPARFKAILDRFGDNPTAMKQADIAYATKQIIDSITNGVNGIHMYSMNKPDVAKRIMDSLSKISQKCVRGGRVGNGVKDKMNINSR